MPTTGKLYLGSTQIGAAATPWYAGLTPIVLGTCSISLSAASAAWGAWTQAVAATSGEADMIEVQAVGYNATATNTATLLQIGIGTAGNEVPLFTIPVSSAGYSAGSMDGIVQRVPVRVPSGSRIAARATAAVSAGAGQIKLNVYKFGDPSLTPTAVDTLGVSETTWSGTPMSASANTYVTLVASTSAAYQAVALCISAASNSLPSSYPIFTFGVGGAGSEVTIGTKQGISNTGEQFGDYPISLRSGALGICGYNIPAGSRIAAKCDNANASYHASLIGIPYV